nr:hypothetical protein [Demequina litorisediminis]
MTDLTLDTAHWVTRLEALAERYGVPGAQARNPACHDGRGGFQRGSGRHPHARRVPSRDGAARHRCHRVPDRVHHEGVDGDAGHAGGGRGSPHPGDAHCRRAPGTQGSATPPCARA